MSTGGPDRRGLSWWRRHGRRARLNPNSIRTAGIHSERHVERYMRNGGRGSWSPVCVVKLGWGGGYFAREGAHRIEAARRTGRSVKVLWVHEREEQAG